MHYTIEQKYMVRTPIMPESTFWSTFCNDNQEMIQHLIKLSKSSIVQEALLIGSPSLYKSLQNIEIENWKSKGFRHTMSSLARFINRMSTRATPLGLFAKVTFENKTNSNKNLNSPKQYKNVVVDYSWLSSFCNLLGNKKMLLPYLKIRWNALAINRGDNVILEYTSGWGNERHINGTKQALIKKLPIVVQIEEICKKEITLMQALNILKDRFSTISECQITTLLKKLIDCEFLLTNLRPEIVNTNDFNRLMDWLSNIPEMSSENEQLKKVARLIEEYETTAVGEGIQLYQRIIREMSSICKAENYLKVDLFSAASNAKVPDLEKIQSDINGIIAMTPYQNRFPELKAYIDTFARKYGEARLVPLLDVLDPEQGCGSPYVKGTSDINYRNSREEEIATASLRSIMEEAVLQQKKMVNLKNVHHVHYSSNFDRGFEVFTRQCADCITGEELYEILPNTGSDQTGKAGGRFKANDNGSHVRRSDALPVELVELFKNPHFLNVSQNSGAKPFETVIGASASNKKEEIRLDDILVGIEMIKDEKCFFFVSKNTGKRLTFYASSMINYESNQIFSPIGRFLLECSMYRIDNPFFISNLINSSTQYPYFPALRYNQIVISKRRWNLNNSTLSNIQRESDIKNAILAFINKWDVPDCVYLEHGDTRLLIRLSNDYQLNEIVDSIRKYGEASLSEYLRPIDNFAREYVYSFDPNQVNLDLKVPERHYTSINSTSPQRMFMPGDKWTFFKLYGVSNHLTEIISNHLYEFTGELKNRGLISENHYLVYKDEDGIHLRIRYKSKSGTKPTELMSEINKWAHFLIDSGLIDRIEFDTYQREIERYGGINFMPAIEHVFTVDSEVSTDILRSLPVSSNKTITAIMTIIDYLNFLGLDLNHQEQLVSQFDNPINRRFFKQARKELHDQSEMLIRNILDRTNHPENGRLPRDLFLDKAKDSMIEKSKVNDMTYLSLIHMHCNRLLISRKQEERIMYLLAYLLNKTKLFRESGGSI